MGWILVVVGIFGSMISGFAVLDRQVQRKAEQRCAKNEGAPCACGYIATAPGRGHYVCFVQGTPAASWQALQREADAAYQRWLDAQPR